MSNQKAGAYIISDNSVTFVYKDQVRTVTSTNAYFNKIIGYVKQGRFDKALHYADIRELVKDALGKGAQIVNGGVYYNGTPINTYLAKTIIKLDTAGHNTKPLLKFLENLMQNPSKLAQDELYQFLEYGDMPITEDGCFLAYKYVREDFKDYHTGTLDYTPGKVVEMPREDVCADRTITCSSGLHFCSFDYLKRCGFNGTKVIILKVNPADVVSIPNDYNNTKGRACKVMSVCEWENPFGDNVLSDITLANKDFDKIEKAEVHKKKRTDKIKKVSEEVSKLKLGSNVTGKCPSCGKKVTGARSTFTSGHGKKCTYCGAVLKGKDIVNVHITC